MNRKLAVDIVEFMNGIANTDPAALLALLNKRVKCSRALANHPTVQVRGYWRWRLPFQFPPRVGMLGILNGMVGAYPNGVGALRIAVQDRHGTGLRFEIVRADGTVLLPMEWDVWAEEEEQRVTGAAEDEALG